MKLTSPLMVFEVAFADACLKGLTNLQIWAPSSSLLVIYCFLSHHDYLLCFQHLASAVKPPSVVLS
jgi:hypothetical protein